MDEPTGPKYPVQEVSDLDIAFPAEVMHLLPPYEAIPEQFHSLGDPWHRFASDWFVYGLKEVLIEPREGIDTSKALRHLRAIMGSFQPKHEHKIAGCAYLCDLWFKDIAYECGKRTAPA